MTIYDAFIEYTENGYMNSERIEFFKFDQYKYILSIIY